MISLTSPPWWTFELRNAPAKDVGYCCEESDCPNDSHFQFFQSGIAFMLSDKRYLWLRV